MQLIYIAITHTNALIINYKLVINASVVQQYYLSICNILHSTKIE